MSHGSDEPRSLQNLLRQAALQQLANAVQLLSRDGVIPPASVHETRKSVKRVRAVMRLIRDDLGSRFEDWNNRMQAVNRRLSSTRDLDVCLATLRELESAGPASHRPLALELQSDWNAERSAFTDDVGKKMRQALVDDLQGVAQGMASWQTAGDESAVIRPAVREMVQRARRLCFRLDENAASDEVHTLRKIIKLRLYWLEFLQPVWPAGFRAEHKLVNALSDNLGRHHDLIVLEERVLQSEMRRPLASSAVESLCQQLHSRQKMFLVQGLYLAQRLFVERPRAFARRWIKLVDLWQAGPNSEAKAHVPALKVNVAE